MPLPPRTYASLTWQPVAHCIYENAFEFSQFFHAIVLTMGRQWAHASLSEKKTKTYKP